MQVSNSHSPDAREDIRIAACTNGPGQEIEVWKSCSGSLSKASVPASVLMSGLTVAAFIPEVKVSLDAAGNHRAVTLKLSAAVGIVGVVAGGVWIYAAMNWL